MDKLNIARHLTKRDKLCPKVNEIIIQKEKITYTVTVLKKYKNKENRIEKIV